MKKMTFWGLLLLGATAITASSNASDASANPASPLSDGSRGHCVEIGTSGLFTCITDSVLPTCQTIAGDDIEVYDNDECEPDA